ncbi:MAG: hypothetical protein BAA04_03190 [Firmicutes bacterium ZCTH02-B6]|nr:MAG: hypothetical protein BAA04_03190 [Firmicutes bacterium ZCTH02-B6]
MGKLSESWSRWFREGGGGRWPRLPEGQAQFTRYLILLLALGVLLMTLNPREARDTAGRSDSPALPDTAVPASASGSLAAAYARELESLVREALLQIHGVNRVHVSITLAASTEKVLAEQSSRERRVSEEPAQGAPRTVIEERHTAQPVLLRRDQGRQEEALVMLERMPPIQGVVVVADAAADSRLRWEISRAVATLLGVPAYKVYVLAQVP